MSTTRSTEHNRTNRMPKVNAMCTCICWNIGATSLHRRDWTLGDTTCSDKIFIKNVTYFTFIRSCDRVLGDLSRQGEARFSERNLIVFQNFYGLPERSDEDETLEDDLAYFRNGKNQQCQFLSNPGLYCRQCPYCITYLELTVCFTP